MSSQYGPRSPRSRARATGSRAANSRTGSGAGRGRQQRGQQAPEGPIRATAQILLGLFLSCSIGFLCFGILAAVAYLIYSMFK
jgi:hypothetical protein